MQRFFAPGVPPKVVFGCDFGRGERAVKVLLRRLEDGGIKVLDVQELTVSAPAPMPANFLARSVGDGKPPNAAHGPQRKGVGGKVRRW